MKRAAVALAAFAVVLLCVDLWLRYAGGALAGPRVFGLHEIYGVAPWCTTPIGRPAAAATETIPVTCAWLSREHCEKSNKDGLWRQEQVCIENPLPGR